MWAAQLSPIKRLPQPRAFAWHDDIQGALTIFPMKIWIFISFLIFPFFLFLRNKLKMKIISLSLFKNTLWYPATVHAPLRFYLAVLTIYDTRTITVQYVDLVLEEEDDAGSGGILSSTWWERRALLLSSLFSFKTCDDFQLCSLTLSKRTLTT